MTEQTEAAKLLEGITSGEWETHLSFDASGYPCFFIHGMAGDEKRDMARLEANAKLIAAAPRLIRDLLAALAAKEQEIERLVATWRKEAEENLAESSRIRSAVKEWTSAEDRAVTRAYTRRFLADELEALVSPSRAEDRHTQDAGGTTE